MMNGWMDVNNSGKCVVCKVRDRVLCEVEASDLEMLMMNPRLWCDTV